MGAKRPVLAAALGAIAIVFSLALVSAQSASNGGLESVGVRYQDCTTPPRISREQAIEAAKSWSGPSLFEQATQVEANYVLFSDGQYYTTDENGQRRYMFQNVPAWVVTLRGLSMMAIGGRIGSSSSDRTAEVNTELNVVINAQTGEYMEAFTYR